MMLKDEQLPHVRQPPSINLITHRVTPESIEIPTINKRHSRNILGLFSRGKSGRDESKEEASTGRNVVPTSVRPVQDRSRRMSYLRKERPQRLDTLAYPIPFSEALSKATKYKTLAIPIMDAENLLKMSKQQQEAHNTISEEGELYLDMKSEETKRRLVGDSPLEWRASIFVLTVDGVIYQYPAAGMPERLPDRFIQLNSGSAAFASDAIPGRHWVLQVTKSFGQNPATTPSRSRLSRIGLRSMKGVASNMLLVMENAEDMESWLAAVRHEIISQGSETYQAEKWAPKSSTETMNSLQEQPGGCTLATRVITPIGHTSPINKLSYDTPGAALNSLRELTDSMVSPDQRPDLSRIASEDSKTAIVKTITNDHGHLLLRLDDKDTSPESSITHDFYNSSLLPWELPANFNPTFSPTSPLAQSVTEIYERQDSEDLGTRGYRSPSLCSDAAPNFSVPTFSHRFSQSTRSGTFVTTPPQSSGSSYRAPSPVQPTKDLLGRRGAPALPFIITNSSTREVHGTDEIRSDAFNEDWTESEDSTLLPPLDAPVKLPKRFSSLNLLSAHHWNDADDGQELSPPMLVTSRRLSSLNPDSPKMILTPKRFSSLTPDSPRLILPSTRSSFLNPDSPTTRHGSLDVVYPKLNAYEIRRNSALGISFGGAVETTKPSPMSSTPAAPTRAAPSIPGSERSPVFPKYSPTTRPQSLQVIGAANRLHTKPSFNTSSTTPSIKTTSIRQRRSIPSHLLGPPLAPPPSKSLPAIPRPKTAVVSC